MPDLKQLYDAVVSGDAKATHAITQQALTEGIDPLKLVNEFTVPPMDEVGRRFESNESFVPELLISARAMKATLDIIRRLLTARGDKPLGRVAIGEVGELGIIMRLDATLQALRAIVLEGASTEEAIALYTQAKKQ